VIQSLPAACPQTDGGEGEGAVACTVSLVSARTAQLLSARRPRSFRSARMPTIEHQRRKLYAPICFLLLSGGRKTCSRSKISTRRAQRPADLPLGLSEAWERHSLSATATPRHCPIEQDVTDTPLSQTCRACRYFFISSMARLCSSVFQACMLSADRPGRPLPDTGACALLCSKAAVAGSYQGAERSISAVGAEAAVDVVIESTSMGSPPSCCWSCCCWCRCCCRCR